MNTNESIPVVKDLFRWTAGTVNLVGSHCKSCGAHYFPKRLSCCNPDCDEKDVIEVSLSRHGRLHSFTIQGYRPPALFKMEPWSPYAIGLIDLPEGIRVMGMLTGSALDEFVIDMEMELTVEVLYRDEIGRDVVTYKFKPAQTGGVAA